MHINNPENLMVAQTCHVAWVPMGTLAQQQNNAALGTNRAESTPGFLVTSGNLLADGGACLCSWCGHQSGYHVQGKRS